MADIVCPTTTRRICLTYRTSQIEEGESHDQEQKEQKLLWGDNKREHPAKERASKVVCTSFVKFRNSNIDQIRRFLYPEVYYRTVRNFNHV